MTTTAPHEEVDLSPVVSGEIWNYRNGKEIPLFVTWISEWDCGYKTDWWYVICEGTFSLDNLSSSSRRNIRKALRNCRVERIDPSQYIEDLWRVFNEAIETVKAANNNEFTDLCSRHLYELAANCVMSQLMLRDATKAPELFEKSMKVYLNLAEAEVAKHYNFVKSVDVESLESYRKA